MRAGRLRHRITVQEPSTTQGGYGPEPGSWSAVSGLGSVPASYKSLRGTELYQAQSVNSEILAEFRCRYQSGLTDQIDETMRISYEGKLYNIIAVLPDETMRRELVISVGRGLIDTGGET